jgi:restriction endonuclease Mrr
MLNREHALWHAWKRYEEALERTEAAKKWGKVWLEFEAHEKNDYVDWLKRSLSLAGRENEYADCVKRFAGLDVYVPEQKKEIVTRPQPAETMPEAAPAMPQASSAATLNGWLALDARSFERACASLLLATGYDTVQITPFSGDGGVDLVATSGEHKHAGSCKRYTGMVDPADVRALFGVIAAYPERFTSGLLITTGRVTDATREFARKAKIELIDGPKLVALAVSVGFEFRENNTKQTDLPEGGVSKIS